jgi:N-acetylglucosaminyldiphosphoundecaprenol N-acetyl-beta-D-mannosaminyltransferase
MAENDTIPKVNVLGIPIYAADISSAASSVINNCSETERRNYCVSATGAHGLVFAKKNKQFEETLKSFFLNLPDGMPGVWIGKIKGAKQMKRCYGPSFFEEVMIKSKDLPMTHFFCGGNEGIAVALKGAVSVKFHNDRVVGTLCPPFLKINDYNYAEIAAEINRTNANVVWIGLSTPKQELFAANLAKKTNVNYIITVGAAFDFHTDKVRQAPHIIQIAGLEWLFRLIMEPQRLYKRYLEIVPLFIYYNFKEFLNFASQKLKV